MTHNVNHYLDWILNNSDKQIQLIIDKVYSQYFFYDKITD